MAVPDRLTDFMQKNPRAALNYAAVLALVAVFTISVNIVKFFFNRDETRTGEAILELKKENLELRKTVHSLTMGMDSLENFIVKVEKAHLLQEIRTKDSINNVVSGINKKLEIELSKANRRIDEQTQITTINTKLATRLNKKSIDVLKKQKEEENEK